jgi:trimethylamine:corrinoid methyltransferase-like protein
MIRKTTTGIHLSDAHRTPDLIERVGTSGNYLTEPETIEHFREVWFPSFLDRRTYQAWFNAGGLTMEKRLNLKVQETLKDYRPKELKPETINEIKRIVENAGHRHP